MQGTHKMWKAVKFMSTTCKTFDTFPLALDLSFVLFYWKLVQHAAFPAKEPLLAGKTLRKGNIKLMLFY